MSSAQQKAQFVEEHVSADLQFLWSDSGVELDIQYDLSQNYKSVRMFASMADDRADLKKALKDQYNLDPAADAATRVKVATVICAFESAQEFVEQEAKLRAEQKILGAKKMITAADKTIMKKAVESTYGQIPDKECPSPEYLALKLEEIEDGEYVASTLDTMTSRVDLTSLDIETTLDSAGIMRVTRKKGKGKLPVDTEEYRTKLRVEANTWLMIASKMRSKPFLQGLTPQCFGKFVDHVLGDKVATLKVPDPLTGVMQPLSPPWNIVLHYEQRLREAAFRLVREDGSTLSDALKAVTKDAELKELHFTGILAVTSSNKRTSPVPPPVDDNKWRRRDSKGKGGRKGGGGKQGGGRGGKGGKPGPKLLWKTDDGRNICFAYNSSKGCKGNCDMAHICRFPGCGKAHPAFGNHTHPSLS